MTQIPFNVILIRNADHQVGMFEERPALHLEFGNSNGDTDVYADGFFLAEMENSTSAGKLVDLIFDELDSGNRAIDIPKLLEGI